MLQVWRGRVLGGVAGRSEGWSARGETEAIEDGSGGVGGMDGGEDPPQLLLHVKGWPRW